MKHAMFRLIISILTIFCFTACNNLRDEKTTENDRSALVPEPDKDLREKYEAAQKLKTAGCALLNPDTSLGGIQLRDSKSADSIINDKDSIDDYDQYHFYSAAKEQVLTLTQHPGDGKYQISIFKVEYPGKANNGYRKLSAPTFKTEKGIELGLSKKQVIEKLGGCYIALDSSKDFIELYYRLELPGDSSTRILERNNMPVYYASYKFRKDHLEKFEFGFEYP